MKEISGELEEGEKEREKKMKQMDEEINYLKKHYEVEMGILKDENEILQKEIKDIISNA